MDTKLEKIARKLLGFNRMGGIYSKREWNALEEHVKAYWLRNADQIQALISDKPPKEKPPFSLGFVDE